jgi:uncharacterized membrane protein
MTFNKKEYTCSKLNENIEAITQRTHIFYLVGVSLMYIYIYIYIYIYMEREKQTGWEFKESEGQVHGFSRSWQRAHLPT